MKEGWMVGLGQEGVALEWGNCLKYLKRGWNKNKGSGNKDFKNGGQAGSRGGCLKKRGLKPPCKLCMHTYLYTYIHMYIKSPHKNLGPPYKVLPPSQNF